MRRCILLAVVALAGCGGSDDEGEDTGAAGGQTVTISLVDFQLDPSTVELDNAGTYTFRATNDGGTQHALEIEGQGIEEETETLDPGDSGDVDVDLEEGTYELYCPIDGHRDQGMEETLVVGGGGGTTTDETETENETETEDD